MIRPVWSALTCCLLSLAAWPAHSQLPTRTDTLHVLFVGNSYLYYNNAPAQLEAVARAAGGPAVQTRLVAHGGWTLEDHLADSATRLALSERQWDWVVANEQSLLGDLYFVNGSPRIHSAKRFAASAQRLSELVKERGARLLILGHWSRREAPQRDLDALSFALDSVTRALNIALIPANRAWRSPALAPMFSTLYDPDGSHPSPTGTYLLANVIYASVTGRAPLGALTLIRGPAVEQEDGIVHPDSEVTLVALPAPTARLLQRVAWESHVGYRVSRRKALVGRTPPLALPSLPSTREPLSPQRLAGSWNGTTALYPGTEPTPFTLTIDVQGAKVSGVLKVRPRTTQESQSSVEILVAGDSLRFVDPNGPNGGKVAFRGILSNGQLRGVAEFVIPQPWLAGIGSWQARRP